MALCRTQAVRRGCSRNLQPQEGTYEHSLVVLRDHRDQLDSLAEALLEHETLD